ncbi:hypothetical protein VIBHAR_06776 [Vibrio campbellii ATCC BAA-1116]|uniref:Uncharacterized protein n=1 Tax=Vibrio campbellii (strain ATCC BAA-1116) TaxID=2902295 RepID=A7MUS9_VIBC1|nr:hypothetical protein VIBHAR_02818 [Vibrio campbellii ATCC BAA-1116]ABU74659.1 hypothetical protein VIBHAR_06776 [Vibrio campbellii ATCC BAA-1116]
MLSENTSLTQIYWDLSPKRSVVSGSPSPLALISRFIGAHPNNEQQSCLHLG